MYFELLTRKWKFDPSTKSFNIELKHAIWSIWQFAKANDISLFSTQLVPIEDGFQKKTLEEIKICFLKKKTLLR